MGFKGEETADQVLNKLQALQKELVDYGIDDRGRHAKVVLTMDGNTHAQGRDTHEFPAEP